MIPSPEQPATPDLPDAPTVGDLTPERVRALPTAVLHDHLDGGLRPGTVLDLCAEQGIDAPGADAAGVADWFETAASSGSLPRYIATFDRTLAVMQTAPALARVAREFVEDMVADGVVYAETRWAPQQHRAGGLTLDEAVTAVQVGLDAGVAAAAARGHRIVVGQILSHMRQLEPTEALVAIAEERRGAGVVGVDLAGPEDGFPASRFRDVLARARRSGVRVTVHAGEADGVSSIADALDCGAERLGHGVRLLEDLGTDAEGTTTLGPTARRVQDEGVCLEVCPSSNLQTAASASLTEHQVGPLHRAGFRIAISSDNRLMSRTSTTRELLRAAQVAGWTLADLEAATLTALDAGFAPAAQREALRDEVVLPAYAAARG